MFAFNSSATFLISAFEEPTQVTHKEDIKCTINNYSADEAERLGIKEKRRDRDAR